MRMIRVGRDDKGPLDLGMQRELAHYPANPPLADKAAAALQVLPDGAVAGLRKIRLYGFDGIAKLRILALARLTPPLRLVVKRRGRESDHLARPRNRANFCLVSMYPLDSLANGEFGCSFFKRSTSSTV